VHYPNVDDPKSHGHIFLQNKTMPSFALKSRLISKPRV
jgi:hypothetical protein